MSNDQRPTPETDAARAEESRVTGGQSLYLVHYRVAERLERQRNTLLEACENLENDDGAIDSTSWNMIQTAVAQAGGKPKQIPEKTMSEGYRLRLRMRETEELARKMDARFGIARACLESIMTDLPTILDWLDTDTEKVARILLETTK